MENRKKQNNKTGRRRNEINPLKAFKNLRFTIFIALLIVLTTVVLSIDGFSIFGWNIGNSENRLGLNYGLDIQGGVSLTYQIVQNDDALVTTTDVETIKSIIDDRVNQGGTSDTSVQLVGSGPNNVPDRLLVQLPGSSVEPTVNLVFSPDYYASTFSGQTQPVLYYGDTINDFIRLREDERQPLADVITTALNLNTVAISGGIVNEQLSFYTFQLENIKPDSTDVDGNIIKGDITLLEEAINEVYPIQISNRFILTGALRSELFSRFFFQDNALTTAISLESAEIISSALILEPILNFVEEVRSIALTFKDLKIPTILYFGNNGNPFVDIIFELKSLSSENLLDEIGQIQLSEIQQLTRLMESIEGYADSNNAGGLSQINITGGVEEAKALIGSTAQLQFRERICGPMERPPGVFLTDAEWAVGRCNNPRFYTENATEINASDLINAFPGLQPQGASGYPVNIEFNDAGSNAFENVTDRISRNDDRLAIYLDGQELIAPAAAEGIAGGMAIITGNFSQTEARNVAIQLRSGVLPATLELIQETRVSPTLGEDSLRLSLIAGLIGISFLGLFLIAYYRLVGLIALLNITIYGTVLLTLIKLIPISLTLSGIAAFLLSLGFAVDANILMAERLKEELRIGRNIVNSISIAFSRSWNSIRDGNVSTLIITVLLWWFGNRFNTGLIEGFALSLGLGILLSLIFAYFINTGFLRLFVYIFGEKTRNYYLPLSIKPAKAIESQKTEKPTENPKPEVESKKHVGAHEEFSD